MDASYDRWMATYRQHSNEKTAVLGLLQRIFSILHDKNIAISDHFLDLGCGDGEFAIGLIDTLKKIGIPINKYTGLDTDSISLSKSAGNFTHHKPEITTRYIEGNCYEGHMLDDIAPASIALLSQMVYYANDRLDEFMQRIVDTLGFNGIALWVQDAGPLSDMNILTANYNCFNKDTNPIGSDPNTQAKLKDTITRQDLDHVSIEFMTHLTFPALTLAQWQEIEDSKGIVKDSDTTTIKTTKDLLAFTLQGPLEGLDDATRKNFLDDVRKLLDKQDSKLHIVTECIMVLSKEKTSELLPLLNQITQTLVGDTTFKPAIKEGLAI